MAYRLSDQLSALSDPTRRSIFERLAQGPLAVVEIARSFPISRPAISQHLKVLKNARLVADVAQGTRRIYHLDPRGISAIRSYFDQFWGTALTEFQRIVEAEHAALMRGKPSATKEPT